MTVSHFDPSLLARDHKLFLELSQAEAEEWLARVFERVRPHMNVISALVTMDDQPVDIPINLELVLMIANRTTREVASEMADALLTPQRQKAIFPRLNAYCDELLAQDRSLDAAFVQQGLIAIQQGKSPARNPLLVEVCLRSLMHQVSMITGGQHLASWPQ